MQPLTGKQKRFLKGLGQKIQATTIIGKSGPTDQIILNIKKELSKTELIKVRLTTERGAERKITAQEIAKATNSDCVGIVGRTFLLYLPNPELDRQNRISVPK